MIFFAKRVVSTLGVMLAAAIVVFAIMQLLPGDVAQVILGGDVGTGASPERVEALREALHLNDPVHVRFGRWLAGLVQFDFGRSYFSGEPIREALSNRIPMTLVLVGLSVVVSTVIAIPLGIVGALRRNSAMDGFVRVFASAGYSIPNFFLAMLLVLALGWLSLWVQPLTYAKPFDSPVVLLGQLLVPAICLGYRQAAVQTRMVRASMLEALHEDHVRTARSKGLRPSRVILAHALRSGLLPIVTITGLEIVVLFSGTVVIETFFNIPGMGSYLVDGALRRDIPVVQGAVFAIVGMVVVTNLLVDLLYGALDPRVRATA